MKKELIIRIFDFFKRKIVFKSIEIDFDPVVNFFDVKFHKFAIINMYICNHN